MEQIYGIRRNNILSSTCRLCLGPFPPNPPPVLAPYAMLRLRWVFLALLMYRQCEQNKSVVAYVSSRLEVLTKSEKAFGDKSILVDRNLNRFSSTYKTKPQHQSVWYTIFFVNNFRRFVKGIISPVFFFQYEEPNHCIAWQRPLHRLEMFSVVEVRTDGKRSVFISYC
jgi:hypothetical protein